MGKKLLNESRNVIVKFAGKCAASGQGMFKWTAGDCMCNPSQHPCNIGEAKVMACGFDLGHHPHFIVLGKREN